MVRQGMVIATALACLAAGGCATRKYPIALTWSAPAGEAMTCDQLSSELADAGRTRQRIADVQAGRGGERPTLYSTARPDADRAVLARVEGIKATMQAKRCPAT